jgi:hypothetical protein
VEQRAGSAPTIIRFGDASAGRSGHLVGTNTLSPLERERRVLAASVGAKIGSFEGFGTHTAEERAITLQQLRHFTDLSEEVLDRGLWQLQLETMLADATGIEADLDNWSMSEGLHKESAEQKLSEAVAVEGRDVYIQYDPLRNAKLAVLLNKHTSPYAGEEEWTTKLATTTGFSNFIEHVAPTLDMAAAAGTIGYAVGDQLIDVSGTSSSVYPVSGGKISVVTQNFLKGPQYTSRKLVKDGTLVSLHVKPDGNPDSFVAVLADETILSLSEKALTGVRDGPPPKIDPQVAFVEECEPEEEAAKPKKEAKSKKKKDPEPEPEPEPEVASPQVAVEEPDPVAPFKSQMQVDVSTVDGLLTSLLTDGKVSMCYSKKGPQDPVRDINEPYRAVAELEASRCYFANGSVVRHLLTGETVVYYPDGTTSVREVAGAAWTVTGIDGVRSKAGGPPAEVSEEEEVIEAEAVPPMSVDVMTDKLANVKVTLREDETTSVVYEGGKRVVAFPDGTRITTTTSGDVPMYLIECLGFARVTYTSKTDTKVDFASGITLAQRVPAPYKSSIEVVQLDGTTLKLNEDGAVGVLTSPPTSNYSAKNFIHSSTFSLSDLAFETADQNLTSFIADASGKVAVQTGEGAPESSQPHPQFYVIKEDGSVLELFSDDALVDYPERAAKLGSGWHTSKVEVAGSETSKSVTWLQEFPEVNAYHAAYTSVHVLPPSMNRGLEPYAVAQNKRCGPSAICRQLINHEQMDKATRAVLLDSVKSFRHWQTTRIEANKALSVDDPRSAKEKELAVEARQRLVEESHLGDELAISKDDAAMFVAYNTVTAPPPKPQPPPLRPNVDSYDDYFKDTAYHGTMKTLELQEYKGFVPKYWESEEYFTTKAEAEIAAADEAAAAVEAADAAAEAGPEPTEEEEAPPAETSAGADEASGAANAADDASAGAEDAAPAPASKILATRPMMFSLRTLPPIQPAATTLIPTPAELEFVLSDMKTPITQTIKLNNHGAATVRMRVSDVPAGVHMDKLMQPIAPGLSTEVSITVVPNEVDSSASAQKLRVMTTAGTLTLPISFKLPEVEQPFDPETTPAVVPNIDA